jgi:transcriptional regulator with XRE-family HTH domain
VKTSIKPKTLPHVLLGLRQLGTYIRIARKRRRFTMKDIGERLNLSYQTIVRVEKGEPSVSMAAYMSVLWLLGLDSGVVAATHPDQDEAGKALEHSRLPQRVGTKRVVRSEHDF